jgi:hypothetical protein
MLRSDLRGLALSRKEIDPEKRTKPPVNRDRVRGPLRRLLHDDRIDQISERLPAFGSRCGILEMLLQFLNRAPIPLDRRRMEVHHLHVGLYQPLA